MIVSISEEKSSLNSSKQTTIIVRGSGLQGAKGESAIPLGGDVGNLLEKTVTGVKWTNEQTNQIINGGNF